MPTHPSAGGRLAGDIGQLFIAVAATCLKKRKIESLDGKHEHSILEYTVLLPCRYQVNNCWWANCDGLRNSYN
jgi:hypothetical protein